MNIRKHLVLVSGLIIAISFGSDVNAQDKSVLENFYVKSNDSVVADNSLSFGYRPLSNEGLLSNARFEQEVSHSVSVYNENSLDKTKIMSNLLYDFQKNGNFIPYLGVGAGFTHVSGFDTEIADDTLPTYQVMTGLSYISDRHSSIKLHMGYSYSDTIGSKAADNDLHLKQGNHEGAHTVAASLNFSF